MTTSAPGEQTEPQYGPPAHARLRPDAVALVVDGETTTYAEFDDRCRRVAVALARLGVS